MANLIFQKKQLKEGADIYAVKQTGGPHIERVTVGDEITFKRTGTNNNWGFEITFDGAGAPPTISVPPDLNTGAGPSEIDWPVPETTGEFKYNVAFPYDESQEHVVEPLDPVIIINPSLNAPRLGIAHVVAFGVGLIVGGLAVQLF